MKDQFVTFEIAKELKELGFNEECIAYYDDVLETGTMHLYALVNWHNVEGVKPNEVKHNICAPLWQQAIEFLREKHGTDIIVKQDWEDGKCLGYEAILEQTTSLYDIGTFSTYNEAREQAILKAIELLKSK